MKTLLTLLLAALCAVASASGQTIRTLGYNTTNGQIVYSGTNTLTFTNAVLCNANVSAVDLAADNLTVEGAIYFTEALTNIAVTRTNLGLGATWLTNTTIPNFLTAIGLSSTNEVSFETVSVDQLSWEGTTRFEPETGTFYIPINFNNTTNTATTRTNLGLGATWLTNTNATNFRTAIGLGAEDSPQFDDISSSSASISQISADAIGMNGAISWTGTNATANAATTRANLGIPLAALTNTSNVTTMRALSGSTNTNHPFSGSVALTNTNVLVFSNGILQSVQ